MAYTEDDLADPPTSIDPYAVLEVAATAAPAEIKTAYKRLALRLHPDKSPPSERENAHAAFQSLAFAYAILSEPSRRARYDRTGNTADTLHLEDDDFNWADFYRAQYAELVTTEKINDIKASYQNSAEERKDVLEAYRKGKGSMDRVFGEVMLSNVLDDEERFRGYIEQAIAKGEVEALDAYTNETEKRKEARKKRARSERKEAEKHAKDLGLYEKIYGDGEAEGGDDIVGKTNRKKGKGNNSKAQKAAEAEESLVALIQGRKSNRAGAFLDDLEARYVEPRGKKRMADEPSEEAFAEMAERGRQKKENKDKDLGTDEGEPPKRVKSSRGKRAGRGKR